MKKVPELRFPEFEGEWRTKKLGEITTKVGSGKTPKGGQSVYQDEGVALIRSQNVLQGRLNCDELAYISDEINDTMRNSAVKEGDLLLNITGASIGRSAIVPEGFPQSNVNQHVCIIRLKNGVSKYYILQQIISDNIQKQIFSYQAGGNREGLNFEQIKKMKIGLTSKEEQEKIADFFSTLDSRIEIQEEKIKNLEYQKKGYMQRIFSQELRFKDENGEDYPEWELKKIEAMLTIKHGKDQKKIEVESGKFPILGTGGEIGSTNTPLYSKPSVLIGRKGTINKPQYMDTPFWTVDTLFYSIIKEGYLPKYIYYLFNTINWLKHNEASGVPSLSAKTVESIKVESAQVVSEQQKISNFLSLFDKKIEIEKKILETLQEMKRGFLQKMFV